MAKPNNITRTEILSRTLLATAGSYLLASMAAVAIARLMPDSGRTGVSLGEMIGFLLFGAAAILAFSINSLTRAWLVVAGPIAALALIVYFAGALKP